VVLGETVGIEPALARLFQFRLRAQVGPGGIVELQITAADVIESPNSLFIGLGQIVEYGVAVGVFLGRDGSGLQAEMQNRRARDRHLRRDARVRLEELEMLEHRVVRKAELACDPRRAVLGLNPMELNAVIDLGDLDAVEHSEEVEMPPGSAKFAV